MQHSFVRFFGASDLTLQDFDGQPLEGSDRGPFHRMAFAIIWVCLKMLCTPKANGFADHYPY